MKSLDDDWMVDLFDSRPDRDEDLPPLKDWPPREIVERRAALRDRALRRRRVRRRVSLAVLVVVVGVAGVAAVGLLRRPAAQGAPPGAAAGAAQEPPVGAPAPPAPSTLVWAVEMGARPVSVVMAVPGVGHPAALVMPNETELDLPGGGPVTVGEAARDASVDPGTLVAAVQASLNRRVEHYLVSDASQLVTVVDLLGGIDVQTEVGFAFDGRFVGPGEEHLSGGAVLAYLETAYDADLTARWEEVLAGLVAAPADASAWSQVGGQSDDVGAAQDVLARITGGIVLELPTAPSLDGRIAPDPPEVARVLGDHFGPDGAPLIRVIVLNGNGEAGVSARVASVVSPSGFQVIAAQNAPSFDVVQTQVIASNADLGEEAQLVLSLLGQGMVYVDPQPTGIADITVLVGKDFQSG